MEELNTLAEQVLAEAKAQIFPFLSPPPPSE